jgi:predicted acylesterase/phospholipase RssA
MRRGEHRQTDREIFRVARRCAWARQRQSITEDAGFRRMKNRVALVLSGGGLFGAWQAGAWRALSDRLQPDLIVGASVGALNGYAIAGGASPEELVELWLRPEFANLRNLPHTIRALMSRYPLTAGEAPDDAEGHGPDYALILTDLLKLKPKIFQGGDITWRHLAASCAIPGVLPIQIIDGRRYCDGGLLNPLPVWAAVELGATHIVALHALPEIPSRWLKPLAAGFRKVAGHHPPLPEGVELLMVQPAGALGSVRDSLHWRRGNIERWLDLGYRAAKNISISNCIAR